MVSETLASYSDRLLNLEERLETSIAELKTVTTQMTMMSQLLQATQHQQPAQLLQATEHTDPALADSGLDLDGSASSPPDQNATLHSIQRRSDSIVPTDRWSRSGNPKEVPVMSSLGSTTSRNAKSIEPSDREPSIATTANSLLDDVVDDVMGVLKEGTKS